MQKRLSNLSKNKIDIQYFEIGLHKKLFHISHFFMMCTYNEEKLPLEYLPLLETFHS